jgi:hypothetical protein
MAFEGDSLSSSSSSSSSSSPNSEGIEQEENGMIISYIPIQTDDESSSSSDESESSASEEERNHPHSSEGQDFNLSVLPFTRDHSYLPGTQHPLYPAEFLRHRPAHPTAVRNFNNHITAQQDDSSNPSWTIKLPILQLDGVVIFPNTTLPLRITNNSFSQYLRREIDQARARIVSSCSNRNDEYSKHNDNMQVRIGIVTRLQHRRRALVHRLRRETAVNQDIPNQTGNEEQPATEVQPEVRVNRRMGRWNMALIRRNIIPSRRNESSSSSDDASSVENSVTQDSSGQMNWSSSAPRRNPEERSINYGRSLPTDRLKGRIGTVATVISVNEVEPRVDSDSNLDNSQDIIITVMTT